MPEVNWMKLADIRHDLLKDRQLIKTLISVCGKNGCPHQDMALRFLGNIDYQLQETTDYLHQIINDIDLEEEKQQGDKG